MFPASTTSGFYNAPVTKGVLGALVASHGIFGLIFFDSFKDYMLCRVPQDTFGLKIWRIFTAKLTFVDTTDMLIASFLIYYMRVFERRYGSRKFASNMIASGTVALSLEVLVLSGLSLCGFHDIQYLSIGPYALVFPMLVNFYHEIACDEGVPVLGLNLSAKSLTYILSLQLASSSLSAFIASACGIIGGFLVHSGIVSTNSFKWIPDWQAKLCSRAFSWIKSSQPPRVLPFGATLEIQRQNNMEMLENQMFGANNPFPSYGNPGFLPQQNEPAMVEPSEENIQRLVDMGFDEERARNALVTSHNDVSRASNLLLQET